MRLQVGDRVEVIAETTGTVFIGAIKLIAEAVVVEIQELLAQRQRPGAGARASVTLLLGSIKPALEELVVEKAVELGINAVLLFAAERSNRAPHADRVGARLERLSRVAEAAMKQSGTALKPRLAFYPSLKQALDALDSPSAHQLIFLAPQGSPTAEDEPTDIKRIFLPQTPPISESAEDLLQPLEVIAEDVDFHILIGPEGGFSSDELLLARNYRFRAVSLGSSVLRAETAAIVACGIVQTLRP